MFLAQDSNNNNNNSCPVLLCSVLILWRLFYFIYPFIVLPSFAPLTSSAFQSPLRLFQAHCASQSVRQWCGSLSTSSVSQVSQHLPTNPGVQAFFVGITLPSGLRTVFHRCSWRRPPHRPDRGSTVARPDWQTGFSASLLPRESISQCISVSLQ